MDVIAIQGLRVDCVVGLYPHERHTPQPVDLDVELFLSIEDAGARERLSSSVDYAAVTAQLAFLLQSCRFYLLETAALALLRFLLLPPATGERKGLVERARLRLSKPGALAGRARPSLRVERSAEWAQYVVEQKPFGTVDVVHETREAGIYRLNLAPGGTIPLHHHARMHESEMVLGSGVHCQDREVAPGTVHRWPLGAAHRYHNPTGRVQSVLCVDAPPFIEADEIAVEGEPAVVLPEPAFVQWLP